MRHHIKKETPVSTERPPRPPSHPYIPPEELNLDPYTQDALRVVARRCLEKMWLSGKAEIARELLAELFNRAQTEHW
jgi:hypothetical protein